MIKIFKLLLINPFTLWVKWLILRYRLKSKNNTLSFGYMAEAINCSFGNYNHIYGDAKIVNVNLGDYSYVGGQTKIYNATIGNYCSIASDCRIGLGIHPTNFISTHPSFYSNKNEWGFQNNVDFEIKEYEDITIGHDVWIGTRAIIVDGIKIGNGAVIAAGAVVTKDVPNYAMVGGVPAKILKYRFDELVISKIEQSEWWHWDKNKIRNHYKLFLAPSKFINIIN